MRRGKASIRGTSLIEYLVGALVGLIIGAALYSTMAATHESQSLVLNQNTAAAHSRAAVDTLVDGLRGCAAVSSATSTSVTWKTNEGSYVRYWLSNGNLVRTVNGSPSGGRVVLSGVSYLQFTYGTWDGYSWTYTATPSNTAYVVAARITVVATFTGYTRKFQGSVRLRQRRCNITGTSRSF